MCPSGRATARAHVTTATRPRSSSAPASSSLPGGWRRTWCSTSNREPSLRIGRSCRDRRMDSTYRNIAWKCAAAPCVAFPAEFLAAAGDCGIMTDHFGAGSGSSCYAGRNTRPLLTGGGIAAPDERWSRGRSRGFAQPTVADRDEQESYERGRGFVQLMATVRDERCSNDRAGSMAG
jgi:hypothetical protein